MDWSLVQNFVNVVDAGSMSEAARRCGMTRSAISQRLKQLETQANAQLLRRTTRELEPTDIGLMLYEHGKRIALQFEAAQFDVASHMHKLSGLVRISLPFGIGLRYIAPILRRFAEEHPDVGLRVIFNNRPGSLIEAEIDIALRVSNSAPDDVVAREVCDIRWHFYGAQSFGAVLESPSQLEDLPFLSPHDGRTVALELLAEGASQMVELKPRISSENLFFLLDCTREGLGVALLPSYIASDLVASNVLVPVLPGWHSKKNGGKLFIMTLPNRYPTPPAKALIERLQQELPPLLGQP